MVSASFVSPADMSSPNETHSRLPLLQRRQSSTHQNLQQHPHHHQQQTQDLPDHRPQSHLPSRSSIASSLHRNSIVDHPVRNIPSGIPTSIHSSGTTASSSSSSIGSSSTQQKRLSFNRASVNFGGRPSADSAIPSAASNHAAPASASSRVPVPGTSRRKHLSFRTSLLVTPESLRDYQAAQEAADEHSGHPAEDDALDQPTSRSAKRASLIPRKSHTPRYYSIDSEASDFKGPLPKSKFAPHPRRQPKADDDAALGMRGDDLSDELSDYDESTAQDTTSATDIDDCADNEVSDLEDLADNSFGFPSPMFAPKPTPPHLKLEQVSHSIARQEGPRTHIDDSPQSTTFGAVPELNKPLPRSPGETSPLGSVFGGWRGPTPPATEVSSATLASPLSSAKTNLTHDERRSTKGSFIDHNDKADASSSSFQNRYVDNYLSTPSPSSPSFAIAHTASMVDDMEDELKAISSELAASIRREMDLEDLVDRLQDQISNGPTHNNKRSSDYFSDSGYSSTKLSEVDPGREEIDKIRRRSEQEKASIRLELVNKLQDERSKRKDLNRKIKELAEKASHVDIAQINSLDANDRIKNLEETCDELKRKLSLERESKGGLEDLLGALKGQLRDVSDERDNLRDEVIPELRARIEGLEAEAAEHSGLTYESARMQQQLESLRLENSSLRSSIASGPPEEPMSRIPMGLSRSNSLGPSALRSQRKPPSVLARSDSVKNVPSTTESREDLTQRLKDVEAQRDALHSALKSLLHRQEHQNREHLKKIRALESERLRLLTSSPRKASFEKDMSKLRVEVNLLRRRAEEALEQKWQVEKGLGGLKMDLDRAEEEIESLRNLLKEKDILIPPLHIRNSILGDRDGDRGVVSSESLERAYEDLQNAHAESLERIKHLEAENEAGPHGPEESARRLQDMASQVQKQLAANSELRERLSAAVTQGDMDRKAHSQRISEMQERLRGLEEQVVNAQMASEELATRHEEEIANMQESHNSHLRRLQSEPYGNGSHRGSGALLSAAASKSNVGQSLRAVPDKTFEDEAELKTLRAKVVELEKTLVDTEKEMQEVVARMNLAQVEVLNLQEAREAAVRETRRLEQLLRQEQSSGLGGLFRRT